MRWSWGALRPPRLAAAGAIVLVLLLWLPHRVEAHARITSVLPVPSSTVSGPVREVVLKYNEPVDKSLFRATVEGDGGSVLAGPPVFRDDLTVVAPLQPNASGVLVVTWLAVGLDAHPVTGQYYFAVRTAGSQAGLQKDISLAATRVGSFESGAGASGLTAVIEAGRSMEIVVLYLVLGLVLVGAAVLRPRLALAVTGDRGLPSVDSRARRVMLVAGGVSVVLVPLLFLLYAHRLTELLPGVGISRILASSIGAQWAIKAILWLALVGVIGVLVRRGAVGRDWSRRVNLLVIGLAVALAGVFVAGTHVGTGSIGPEWVYIPMMAGHILLTAFWAGGLFAILLVVFPTRDPAQVWPVVSRFSRIMTVTAGIVVASGVFLLIKLLGNFNALWCSSYGVVAGFKVFGVVLALVFGLVNNRMVASHRRFEELPLQARLARRRAGPSIDVLRRVVASEATVLLGVLVLAAVLGETQLPPLFNGHLLPGEVTPGLQTGLLGSGCQ